MEFEERLSALAVKVQNQVEAIGTEEATKTAFVMPFIATILGYDIFNPMEVVPEYTADVGIKRGEKVDYAIMRGGEVQILIECKQSKDPLNVHGASQLFRYFTVTNARIAILTNGRQYHFFTDLDAPNKMDERPFMVLDLLDIDDTLLPELQKLTKETFDLDSIISAAEELKYVGALKRVLAHQFKDPHESFVKFLTTQVYDGRFTQDVRAHFRGLVQKAARQFVNEQVNDRLKSALGAADQQVEVPVTPMPHSLPVVEKDLRRDTEVETTLEELEGYQIVKAIACSEVKPSRVTHRDAKSYFAIFLDDNNRRPLARLWFNNKKQKYLGLFDDDKNEIRHPIDELDEIYGFTDDIRRAVKRFEANR